MKKNIQVKFPLYSNKDENIKALVFSKDQEQAIQKVKEKIKTKEYKLEEIDCLCGNTDTSCVVTERDRYGFNFPNILCPKCGIVRAQYMFDQESLVEFYKNEYRQIYIWRNVSDGEDIRELFRKQQKRGNRYIAKLEGNKINLSSINKVCEVGSACGGILLPFKNIGKKVVGCDFERDYLDHGRKKGLDLRFGDIDSVKISDSSQDIIILSHVLEHLLNPIGELNTIVEKLKKGGYLLVEVPSVLNLYTNPLSYFQNAHVYNFAKKNLEVLFRKMGLDVIYSDELSFFILSKPSNWKPIQKTVQIYDSSLKNQAKIVEKELKGKYLKWEICNKVVREKNKLEENIEVKEETLIDLQRQKETLVKENKELKNAVTQIKQENKELIKRVSILDRDLSIIEHQNQSIKKAMGVLRSEKIRFKSRVSELQNSNWYKLVKRLRKSKVYMFFRRMFLTVLQKR
jgi:SAM-dependent methyltransferase